MGTKIDNLKCIAGEHGRHARAARPAARVGLSLQWLLVLGCAIAATGCGSKSGATAHLQGSVTLDGKPLPDDATAFIMFAPDGKGADSVSVPITKGRYDAVKVPQGPVKVFFDITRPVGPTKKSEHTGQSFRDTANLVPDKYATGIPLKVDGDDPNRDFQLTN